MRTNLVTPPAVEPVTLDEAKAHLRLELDFLNDDASITSLITAARKACESRTKSKYITQTWDLFLDNWPTPGRSVFRSANSYTDILQPRGPIEAIRLPYAPVQSVTSIQYYDLAGALQTLDPALYNVSVSNQPTAPGRIAVAPFQILPFTQTNRVDSVQIRFVSGYGLAVDVPEEIKLAIKILVGLYYENREEPGAIPKGVDALLDSENSGTYI